MMYEVTEDIYINPREVETMAIIDEPTVTAKGIWPFRRKVKQTEYYVKFWLRDTWATGKRYTDRERAVQDVKDFLKFKEGLDKT